MIAIEPVIACSRAFLMNVFHCRPLIPKNERMSLLDEGHEPSDPTTSGRILPKLWYFSILRFNAALRFSGLSYATTTSTISLVPLIDISTSGLSCCSGSDRLIVAAYPFLSISWWRSPSIESCLCVYFTRCD